MEKRLQKIKICRNLLIAFLCCLPVALSAQQPSQKDKIRIQIWSELDAFPGKFDNEKLGENPETENQTESKNSDNETNVEDSSAGSGDNGRSGTSKDGKKFVDSAESRDISIFDYAIKRAKEISPYLLGGMLSGWDFDYVPYDKTRRVTEYFELTEVEPFNPQVNKISYKEPMPVENRLVCWVECERTAVQKLSYERWKSITHPRITGHGTASVEDGFEGIKAACSAAVKNAVREYWRTQVKNKPKEILGRVLLIQDPRIYIYEGQYVVDLDFFVETAKIVSYSYY